MIKLLCVNPKSGLEVDCVYDCIVNHNDSTVLVYNDLGQWVKYKLSNFKPVLTASKDW